MQIVICSENKAKIKAIQDVFRRVWEDCEFVIEKFDSEVSEQPLSEEEGIRGAMNRAVNAQEIYKTADYCVGMEGYVDTNTYGMFLAGAVAVLNKKGEFGIGMSAKMLLPSFIKKRVEEGEELGPLIQAHMKDVEGNIRQYDGTNGVLSKGLYDRIDEFKNATECALARFRSPELFE